MKKAILLLVFLISTAALTAQEIAWMSMDQALLAQQQTPKKIFMDVYTTWCGPCKLLDKNTFKNKSVVDYVNDNYYAVKFNAEGNDIINFNTLIAENAISINNEKLQSLCSYLHISAERLINTYDKINTYYTLQKALHLHEMPETGEPDPHHIIDVIKSVLHKYDRVKDLDYTEPKPPLFFSKLIHTAAKELIENACKFSEKGTPIVVRIFEDTTGSNISVANTTRHTTAEALNQYRLFEQHHRDVAEQQGLGIGLAITKLIASIYKGSIVFDEVESETSVREIIALLHLPNS